METGRQDTMSPTQALYKTTSPKLSHREPLAARKPCNEYHWYRRKNGERNGIECSQTNDIKTNAIL
ncbi:hypothetical protein E2C01_032371 [Portunus trituberculatus]|uniref:Uncharacterized protein n=1 Tax=Portunus trituberculatus TaxID=210409 RepID=A0A5B7EZG5_PORTR|nr:hypothetical protein [Portunus trituberculatus]